MNDTGNLQQATGCMTFLTVKTAALQQMAKTSAELRDLQQNIFEAFIVIFSGFF